LPEPLRGTDRGSFAQTTVAVRLPSIGERVLTENRLSEPARKRVRALIDEMPHAPVRPLSDVHAPDAESWNRSISEQDGRSWLEVPWFFAETYFYRRIVEAVDYFAPNARPPVDPFSYQKGRGLELSWPKIQAAAADLQEAMGKGWAIEPFVHLLKADLWGNQVDLSLWPADDENHPVHAPENADNHLLIDDAREVARHLEAQDGPRRLDVIVDNAGFELIGDLVLADYGLATGVVRQVVLHVKLHPTFVSDALYGDVLSTIEALRKRSEAETHSFGSRLGAYHQNGSLRLSTHAYWTSPLAGWEMPAEVRAELSESDLVISKGDANYRRLLGDRHWPFETPFGEIVGYFPAPLVALRTYKSEVACGLDSERVAQLAAADPEWLINGRWGLIQAYSPH